MMRPTVGMTVTTRADRTLLSALHAASRFRVVLACRQLLVRAAGLQSAPMRSAA